MRTSILTLLALSAYAAAGNDQVSSSTAQECEAEAPVSVSTATVAPSSVLGDAWTTSTIYSTSTHTVVSCGPEVTSCPAHSTVLTTIVVPISTTVCPVSAEATGLIPLISGASTAVPAPSAGSSISLAVASESAALLGSGAVPYATSAPFSAATTLLKPTSVGTVSIPSKTTTAFVTAGANPSVQRAGGLLIVALAVVGML